jgi:hypothetical protein
MSQSEPIAARPKDQCPKCGKTMCQQFSNRPGPNGITLATPNGEYRCYWCGYDSMEANRD